MIKQIILILGPNGVGKSTTAEVLLGKLQKCAYIDAAWCRAINPFPFTPATKRAVTDNIYCLLRNYLCCEDIDRIILPYAFHGGRKEIFEEVIERLVKDLIEFEVCPIILKCSKEENLKRVIEDGRDHERIERGMKNTFDLYDNFQYEMLDTTQLTPEDVAEEIIKVIH